MAKQKQETAAELDDLDRWVTKRLKNPKFAGAYIAEIMRKRRGVTPELHEKLKACAIRRLIEAHLPSLSL